ncbi:hypothetical protein A2U01_0074432, partial [Trifolium medium]|nr:hypothetical protein [Trifolium medium]
NTSASGAEASEAKSTDGKKATETAATEDVGASEAKETYKGKGPEAITTEVKPATKKDKGLSRNQGLSRRELQKFNGR